MRAQAARSLVNPEVSHGCSQSFALSHPTTDKVKQTVLHLFQPHTPPSRFHAVFCVLHNTLDELLWKFTHRITVPLLSQVPSQLRGGVWAVWAGLTPSRWWEITRGSCGTLHCKRKLCYAVQLVPQRYCGINVFISGGREVKREKIKH